MKFLTVIYYLESTTKFHAAPMELFGSCTEENTYSGFSSSTMYCTLKIKK
jgi:hypothetical protein